MREILFRGIELDSKNWVYGSLISYDPIPEIQETDMDEASYDYQRWEVIPESVGQNTGLLDSKNNEIYEGDLLQDFRKTFIYECIFRENGAFEFQNKTTLRFVLLHELWDNEIIGNIHTNPELLNTANKK